MQRTGGVTGVPQSQELDPERPGDGVGSRLVFGWSNCPSPEMDRRLCGARAALSATITPDPDLIPTGCSTCNIPFLDSGDKRKAKVQAPGMPVMQ